MAHYAINASDSAGLFSLPVGGLSELLATLPINDDPNFLVGFLTDDDAVIYRLSQEPALIATADFITPPVNDPYRVNRLPPQMPSATSGLWAADLFHLS